MASLFHKVKLYLEANGKTAAEIDRAGIEKWDVAVSKIILQDDVIGGVSNPYIKFWDEAKVGIPKPTDEQLVAYDSQADTDEANIGVVNTRKGLYGTTAEQFEYLVENGVDAFIAKQNQIKSDNPKS